MTRLVRDGEPVELQCRVRRLDGSSRVVRASARLELADDGTRSRIVGTVRDVTDEAQAAERERAQLTFIQTMLDAIPIPVFQKDTGGGVGACNKAWCTVGGRWRENHIGRSADELLAGDALAAICDQDERLLERVASRTSTSRCPTRRASCATCSCTRPATQAPTAGWPDSSASRSTSPS
jgi:PAS domain-containing protein